MNSALARQSGVIWLHGHDYKIVALNSSFNQATAKLQKEMERGVCARPDFNRRDFYDVDLVDGWAYIHVHDEAHTVYVVAYSTLKNPWI